MKSCTDLRGKEYQTWEVPGLQFINI